MEHPTADDDLLVRIRRQLPSLPPSLRAVAAELQRDPAARANDSIDALAAHCGTSVATVTRLCRALGYAGYRQLRIELARSAVRESVNQEHMGTVSAEIARDDSLAEIVAKIGFADARAIEETTASLDLTALARAVDLVAGAQRIDVYGVGASGFVAQDLHQKLYRIGKTAFVWPDTHAALTSAALAGRDTVAIGISHTGRTADTVLALREAGDHGASTVAITNFHPSPITEGVDVVLTTAARETTFRSGAMTSRIAQLAVIDCLFVAVAQRHYDRTIEAVALTYDAVRGRIPLRT